MKAYAVSVRLRRVITESVHVSVPVTDDVTEPDPKDATCRRINGEKIFQFAVEQAKQGSTRWELDGDIIVEPHPIQTAPPSTQPSEI